MQSSSQLDEIEQKFIKQHYKDFLVIYSNQFNFQVKLKSNEITYANFIKNNFDSYTGYGFLFKVSYDNDYNPNYLMYEGQFLNGLKNGQGKIFAQKLEDIVYEGNWIKDEKEINNLELKDIKKIKLQQKQEKESRILIQEGDKVVNQHLNRRSHRISHDNWIKFNYQISQNDINILTSHNRWFTSSIIDSYVLYLNIKIDKQYFQVEPQKRKNIQRQIIIPSSVFTQMKRNKIDFNREIFKKYFLEYKRIKFQIEKIYEKFNFHWYLIQINVNYNEMIIMDSIKSKVESYNIVKDIMNGIFNNKIQNVIISDKCNYQKNGYDCGPYTCLHMLMISQIQEKIETPMQMRKFLLEKLRKD